MPSFGSNVVRGGGGGGGNWASAIAPFLLQLSQQFAGQSQDERQRAYEQEEFNRRLAAQEEERKNELAFAASQDKATREAKAHEDAVLVQSLLAKSPWAAQQPAQPGTAPNTANMMFQNPVPNGMVGSQQPGPQGMPSAPFTGQLPAMQAPSAPSAPPSSGRNLVQEAADYIVRLAVQASPQAAQVAEKLVTIGVLPREEAMNAIRVGTGIRESADQSSRAGVAREGYAVEREGLGVRREEMRSSEKIAELQDKGVTGGSFATLTDEQGTVLGFFNPKTKEYVKPPESEVRKSGLSSSELSRRGMLTVMDQSLDELAQIAESNKGSIGFFEGKVAGAKRMTVGVDDQTNDLFRLSDNLADILLRARSGAQINEREYARLRKLVPDPRGPQQKFFADLRSFKQEIGTLKDISMGGGAATPGAGGPQVGDTKRFPNGSMGRWDGKGWAQIEGF